MPRPEPSAAELLAEALIERATVPGRGRRAALRALTRAPRQALGQAGERLVGVGAMAWAGLSPGAALALQRARSARTGATPGSTPSSTRFKAIKNALGGTLNDAVLAAVGARARRATCAAAGDDTDGLVLKAMVPVSVRAETQRGALGNRVAAMWAPLPVGVEDPRGACSARSPRRCAASRSPARRSARRC